MHTLIEVEDLINLKNYKVSYNIFKECISCNYAANYYSKYE